MKLILGLPAGLVPVVSPIHAAYMAKPAQPSLNEQGEHARYSFLCYDILVWDSVSPGDAQNPSEATQVEGVESALLAGIEGPGLATMQQGAEYSGRGTPSSWC